MVASFPQFNLALFRGFIKSVQVDPNYPIWVIRKLRKDDINQGLDSFNRIDRGYKG